MYELENVVKKLKTIPDSDMPEPTHAGMKEDPPMTAGDRGIEASGAIPIWINKKPEARDTPRVDGTPDAPVPLFAHRGPETMSDATTKRQPTDDAEKKKRRFGPVFTLFGAACSLALVIGVSVWTYNLGKRDAMEVPVIKAMAGPSRVAPADRGGRETPHQGLAVNQVLEGGGVRPVARTVVTAPNTDALTDADKTQAELAVIARATAPRSRPAETLVETAAVATVADGAVAADTLSTATTAASEPTETARASGTVDPARRVEEAQPILTTKSDANLLPSARTAPAVSLQAQQDEAPTRPVISTASAPATEIASTESGATDATTGTDTTVTAAATPVAEDALAEPVDVASLAIPGVGSGSAFAPAITSRSPSRPRDLNVELSNAVNAAVQAAVVAKKAEASAPQQVDLATIPLPAGTRMIQLGAYDSETVARREWDRFQRQHSDLLGGKDNYVQRIESSGRIFYRLRVAGYETRADTRAACSALSARGVPCMTATVR